MQNNRFMLFSMILKIMNDQKREIIAIKVMRHGSKSWPQKRVFRRRSLTCSLHRPFARRVSPWPSARIRGSRKEARRASRRRCK